MDREELKEMFLQAMEEFSFAELDTIYDEAKVEFYWREVHQNETETI